MCKLNVKLTKLVLPLLRRPGDVLHVLPCNAPDEITAALDWFALPADQPFTLSPQDALQPVPKALQGALTVCTHQTVVVN